MNFEASSLAVIIAALDGYNPRLATHENPDGTHLIHTTGNTTASDLDIAAHDALQYLNPESAIKDVARAATHIIYAVGSVLGQSTMSINPADVADVLRTVLLTMKEADSRYGID